MSKAQHRNPVPTLRIDDPRNQQRVSSKQRAALNRSTNWTTELKNLKDAVEKLDGRLERLLNDLDSECGLAFAGDAALDADPGELDELGED
jgi:hypothetical protein